MGFTNYLYENGLIGKNQKDEVEASSGKDKEANIIIKKRILPYKDVVRHLSNYIKKPN